MQHNSSSHGEVEKNSPEHQTAQEGLSCQREISGSLWHEMFRDAANNFRERGQEGTKEQTQQTRASEREKSVSQYLDCDTSKLYGSSLQSLSFPAGGSAESVSNPKLEAKQSGSKGVYDATRSSQSSPEILRPGKDCGHIVYGFNSTEMPYREYKHDRGSVFVEQHLAQEFDKPQLNELMNQFPQSEMNTTVTLAPKGSYHPELPHAGAAIAKSAQEFGENINRDFGINFTPSTKPDSTEIVLLVGKQERAANGLDPNLVEVARHEYGHAILYWNPEGRKAYQAAVEAENENVDSRGRIADSNYDLDENFAVHFGEVFMSNDKSRFDSFIDKAPVKATEMAKILHEQFMHNPNELPKTAGQILLEDRLKETLQKAPSRRPANIACKLDKENPLPDTE